MHYRRYAVFAAAIALTIAFAVAGAAGEWLLYWPLLLLIPLTAVGVFDIVQPSRAILRNYPIIGHLRYFFEEIRPSIRQYLIEDDRDPLPFSREQRAIAYRRAKNVHSAHPFGTIIDVSEPGHGWICHSVRAREIEDCNFRVIIGGPACRRPYSASIVNISGMSFGAISANAILALNGGAKMGCFAQNTGEGSISPYHRRPGGDLVWQIATGYFGCRDANGNFDPYAFARTAALPSVKMIELKLSQGAKPGHGGVLPKAKITEEIAATRGVPRDRDCVSPPSHPAFDTPLGMMDFIEGLRELSYGKPIGVKLCVGHRYEFLAMVKAMIETGTTPDYIVVDGTEGGTGAAPPELSDHVGLPLIDGLTFVHNALVGAGLRDRIRLGASGKLITGYDLCRVYALGADFAMIARGSMFASGCIQSRACHTNRCPTGIATQDAFRQRDVVVPEKAERVASFHRNTLKAVAEVIGAAGLSHPRELTPAHLQFRQHDGLVLHGDEVHPPIRPNALVDGSENRTAGARMGACQSRLVCAVADAVLGKRKGRSAPFPPRPRVTGRPSGRKPWRSLTEQRPPSLVEASIDADVPGVRVPPTGEKRRRPTMYTAKDYDEALLNPAAVFKRPNDVLDTDSLTTTQKLEVLKRWETDALLLSVATEENMGGGEPSRIEDVRHAIDVLTRLEGVTEPTN